MKERVLILLTFVASAIVWGCGRTVVNREGIVYIEPVEPTLIDGVTFVEVPATAFTFNEAPSGFPIEGAGQLFEAMEPRFLISCEPINIVELWSKYMDKRIPKSGLSYDDIQKLLDRLFIETSLPVILPSESMYEAALISDAIHPSQGSEAILADGWGMGSVDTSDGAAISHRVAVSGQDIVLRSPYARKPIERFRRRASNVFYIAIRTGYEMPNEIVDLMDYRIKGSPEVVNDGQALKFTVNDVNFDFLPVAGGKLMIGSTASQERYAESDENPLREIDLPSFKISPTEVMVRQWKAVMGRIPSGNNPHYPDMAVVNVSWYDCMEFIMKLREMTGIPVRLPSEEEWEYAARGGQRSHDYLFAGSNRASEVAICTEKAQKGKNKGESVRPRQANVASLRPNELGLYDMSGNAWEWVRGAHPDGRAVLRGGSRLSTNIACRVSNRQPMEPMAKKDSFGLRLAI